MSSESLIEFAFSEVAAWDVFDANVRLGPSALHGDLALDGAGLVAELNRFGIKQALVSHFAAEEYDAEAGNRALARDLLPQFTPAWAALPDHRFMESLWLETLWPFACILAKRSTTSPLLGGAAASFAKAFRRAPSSP